MIESVEAASALASTGQAVKTGRVQSAGPEMIHSCSATFTALVASIHKNPVWRPEKSWPETGGQMDKCGGKNGGGRGGCLGCFKQGG